jgi:exosortase/archaeosortase family protein
MSDHSQPASGVENATLSQGRLGLRFAPTFAAIALALFSIYCYPYAEEGPVARGFARYLSAYAHAAGAILALVDSSVHVTGTQIVGRFSLEIVKNCDAIEVNIIFASAILALPFRLANRLRALAAGITLLVLANILRICSLYFIGVYRPAAFEFFHLEFWPLLLVAFTALNFLLWANWMQRQQSNGSNVAQSSLSNRARSGI